jgi:hypothetical protein
MAFTQGLISVDRALRRGAKSPAMRDSHAGPFLKFAALADTLIDPASVGVALDAGSRDCEIALCLKEHYPNAAVYCPDSGIDDNNWRKILAVGKA